MKCECSWSWCNSYHWPKATSPSSRRSAFRCHFIFPLLVFYLFHPCSSFFFHYHSIFFLLLFLSVRFVISSVSLSPTNQCFVATQIGGSLALWAVSRCGGQRWSLWVGILSLIQFPHTHFPSQRNKMAFELKAPPAFLLPGTTVWSGIKSKLWPLWKVSTPGSTSLSSCFAKRVTLCFLCFLSGWLGQLCPHQWFQARTGFGCTSPQTATTAGKDSVRSTKASYASVGSFWMCVCVCFFLNRPLKLKQTKCLWNLLVCSQESDRVEVQGGEDDAQ